MKLKKALLFISLGLLCACSGGPENVTTDGSLSSDEPTSEVSVINSNGNTTTNENVTTENVTDGNTTDQVTTSEESITSSDEVTTLLTLENPNFELTNDEGEIVEW